MCTFKMERVFWNIYIIIAYIIWFNKIICVSAKCKLEQHGDFIFAFCSSQGYTHVPTKLPRNITSLYLNDNKLSKIKNGELKGYNKLDYLSINHNNLSVLEYNSFTGLRSLRYLFLAGNTLDISSYPEAVFEPISNLVLLDISKNMKNNTKTPLKYSSALVKLKNLKEINIDLMPTPVFGESFVEMKSLQSVVFDYCFLQALTNKTFQALPINLTKLDMKKCGTFFHVEADALRHFPNLQILDLSKSHVHLKQALKMLYPLQNKTMESIVFHRVTYLSITEYDYSVVLTKEMMQYISTICIKKLDLSYNNIVAIRDNSLVLFEHPNCFETLILSANRFGITEFAYKFLLFFQNMTNLLVFDFSYLPLEFEHPTFLYSENIDTTGDLEEKIYEFPNLTLPKQLLKIRLTHIMANNKVNTVKLVNSSLVYLDVSYYKCRTFPFFEIHGKSHLTRLYLSGIQAEMTIGKFSILPELNFLCMSSTELYRVIDKNITIFQWSPNVEFLDISHNFIWYLDFHTLGNLPKLRLLNLSHNMLKVFPNALTQYTNIRKLDLSFNLLTTLEKNSRNWIDRRLKSIRWDARLLLNGNPFVCSCETADFVSWLFTTKVKLDKGGNYTCRTPGGMIHYTANVYKEYHNYFSSCNSSVWLKFGLSFLATTLLLIGCITIMYNFRWRLIFFLSRKFRYFVEKKLNIDFMYDVYISYHGDDASFVKNQLQPRFEKEWGFKMCCKDRDFIGGEPTADAIARSISKSRNVIFLVTQSFKDNEWCGYEIDRAKYEKLTKNLQKIVVIVKDISSTDITTELAEISKDVYIIEWPQYEEGLEFAWNRLRLCLQLIVVD